MENFDNKARVFTIQGSMLDYVLGPGWEETENIKYVYLPKKQYVTDLVGDDWKCFWVPSTPVFLSTQTGTGKNYFVIKKIITQVQAYNRKHKDTPKKVLVLSNRVALDRQMKQDIIKEVNKNRSRTESNYISQSRMYSDKGMDSFGEYGSICVSSYHRLLESGFLDYEFAFVIIDEAHFFCQDATYNPRTWDLLKLIVSNFKSAVRVYMSATFDDVFLPIMKLESQITLFDKSKDVPFCCYTGDLRQYHTPFYYFNHGVPRDSWEAALQQFLINYEVSQSSQYWQHKNGNKITDFRPYKAVIYDQERNYDYLHIKTLNGTFINKGEVDEKLLRAIKNSSGKWLIFVQGIKEGEDLCCALRSKFMDKKTEFICSGSKENKKGSTKIYNEIVANKRFSCDILVSTAVIDNGISIKDSEVKNMAIFIFNRVSFLQMLGRIRVDDEHQVTLYLPAFSSNNMKQWMMKNIKALITRLNFDQLNSEQRAVFFCNDGDDLMGKNGFGIKIHGQCGYSELSKTYLAHNILFLKRMLFKMRQFPDFDFSPQMDDMYNLVLHELEDQEGKSMEENELYMALSDDFTFKAGIGLGVSQDCLQHEHLIKTMQDNFYSHRCYDTTVGYVRGVYLLRYSYWNQQFNVSASIINKLLKESGVLAVDAYKELLTNEDAKKKFNTMIQQRDKCYAKVIHYRKWFNWYNDEPDGNIAITEQLYWLGLDLDAIIPDEEDGVTQVVSKDALQQFLESIVVEMADFKGISAEKSDELVMVHGFKNIDDKKLRILNEYIVDKEGTSLKGINAINTFFEKHEIGYRVHQIQIRSTKCSVAKGKTFWLIVKK